jgi:hypothetical protein
MTLEQTIQTNFPKATQCAANGKHIGAPVVSYDYELDDDRAHLMRFDRCGNCNMPLTSGEYVTFSEQELLRAQNVI